MLSPEGPVYQAGTLSGNPIATTAGLATLRLATDDVYAHLTAVGDTIKDAADGRTPAPGSPMPCSPPARCSRSSSPTGPVRDFAGAQRQDTAAFAAFFHAMLDRGVYLPPSAYEAWFVSAAHDERAVQTVLDALPAAARAAAQAAATSGKEPMADTTIVHLLRHGEVHNPEGVLYGRRDGYHLSDLGRTMAQRVAETIAERDIVHLRTSPLERAQETAAPLAAARGLTPVARPAGDRVGQRLRGQAVRRRRRRPAQAVGLAPPVEPVEAVVGRALQGGHRPDARRGVRRARRRARARGRDRLPPAADLDHPAGLEKRSFLHDPRKRQCTLCSLTSLQFDGDALRTVSYSEPAGDLIPVRDKQGAVLGRRRPRGQPAMRRARALVAAAALLLAATGCHLAAGHRRQGLRERRRRDPPDRASPTVATRCDCRGKDLDGKPLSLASMRGKPTVVTVWGSWCADCHKEAPCSSRRRRSSSARTAHFVGIDSRDAGHRRRPRPSRTSYGITWPSFYSPGGEAMLAFPGVIYAQLRARDRRPRRPGPRGGRIIGAVPSALHAGRDRRGRWRSGG